MFKVPAASSEMYQELHDLLQQQQALLQDAVAKFQASDRTEQHKQTLNTKIVMALEPIVHDQRWQQTAFMRNLVAAYVETYEQACEQDTKFSQKLASPAMRRQQLQEGQCEIFIHLYQTDGYDLTRWDLQLSMLLQSRMTRPIYGAESDIQQVMRARMSQANDAYVIAIIKNTDLLADLTGLKQEDSLGQPLIYLNDQALCQENLIELVHLNKRYPVVKGCIDNNISAEQM